MDITINKKVSYNLTLNEKEAMWLKALVQNPFCHPDDETEENREMRKLFWEALGDCEVI